MERSRVQVSSALGCPEPVTAAAAPRPRGVGEETKEKLPVALPVPSGSGRRDSRVLRPGESATELCRLLR